MLSKLSDANADPRSDAEASGLILRVGARVRAARDARGLTRRTLSELSGVSPRYLAQLEAGEGNISIGLLHRIAIALDRSIDWFVADGDALAEDARRVTDLYRAADAATRSKVMRVLDPVQMRAEKADRVCLVGLRGAGKSTLGAALGRRLEIPFVELNQEIASLAGMPVAEIIALYGQEGYRQLEAEALDNIVSQRGRLVLAVAGGIVAEQGTFAQLLARFHTVWLKASPDEHMARVQAQGDTRPMAGQPQAMAQLRSILTSREAQYRQAEVHLDTSGKPVERSLEDLVRLIEEHSFLS